MNVYGSGQYYKGAVGNPVEYISIDPDMQMLTYYRNDTTLWQGKLPTKAELTASVAGREVSREDLSFALTSEDYDIRLELQNYAIRNPDYKEIDDQSQSQYYSVSGIALIRDAK